MTQQPNTGTLDLLVEALRLAAAPARVQREALPSWVAVPDEVALAFEDARIAQDLTTLSETAVASIMAIEGQIEALRLDDDAWTEDALERQAGWEELRALARAALATLGCSYQPPRPVGHYVQVEPAPRLVGRLVGWFLGKRTRRDSSSDSDADA